jgi:hypothetical protein
LTNIYRRLKPLIAFIPIPKGEGLSARFSVSWHQLNQIYRCIVHFDIKNGKIWLQQNLTDRHLAETLVEMGVPREDIVLGLQPPYKRQYTGYGEVA